MAEKSSSVAKTVVRFAVMTAGLGAIGILFGVGGALFGGRILGADAAGFGALGLAIGGIMVGYPAGIIVGLVLIKKLLHQRGSLLLGILGSIFGAGVTLALAEPLKLNSNTNLLFGTFLLSVPVCCLLGFFLRR
ncbi:MAG: hypothetical protein ABIB93_05725 [Chloroflexota bacterium]